MALIKIGLDNYTAQDTRDERVRRVCETNHEGETHFLTQKLLVQIGMNPDLSAPWTVLFEREFTVENTVNQVLSVLYATESGRP